MYSCMLLVYTTTSHGHSAQCVQALRLFVRISTHSGGAVGQSNASQTVAANDI